jgi:hypothetical protein
MGNYQSIPPPLPNIEKLMKIMNLRSELERIKITLTMDETDLKNELVNNTSESHEQIRNKFNFIEEKKMHINNIEKELNSLSNENFTQLTTQQREQERQNQSQRYQQERQKSSENFIQVSNIPQNGHSQGCKLNRENFSVESESICDSDSCKNLIFNELKRKHKKRLQNNSVKIQLLRQRIDVINNEIINLVNNNYAEQRMTNNVDTGTEQARLNMLKKIRDGSVNELEYLLSFDIEFIELQKEMNTF